MLNSVITPTRPVYEMAAEVLKMRNDCQGHSDAGRGGGGAATPPRNMSHSKTSEDHAMAREVGGYRLESQKIDLLISILCLSSQLYGGQLPAIESEGMWVMT